MKTFLITGATGLIGRNLIAEIKRRRYEYIALSSDPQNARRKLSDTKAEILGYNQLNLLREREIDFVVNLAGSNIGAGRWTAIRKKEIYYSRVDTTRELVSFLIDSVHKPEVFISASGIDYYGDTGSEIVYENHPSGNSFLSRVCMDWETEAMKALKVGIRVVTMRIGVVIAKDAPAIRKILMPYRFFAGGPIGSGEQYFSWIHIDDLISLMLFVCENKEISGPINAVSPNPVKMNELSETLAEITGRPAILRVPEFMLKIIMGEASELVLSSHKVVPAVAENYGFKFRFTDYSEALKNILDHQFS